MKPATSQSDPPPDDTLKRVVELEERLMFSQRALEELNEVVLRQQSEIGRLGRELHALRGLAERAIDLAGGEPIPDEKPPHY